MKTVCFEIRASNEDGLIFTFWKGENELNAREQLRYERRYGIGQFYDSVRLIKITTTVKEEEI